MFEVIFYGDESSGSPVEDFLNFLEPKMRAKLISILEILEGKGNLLRMPYSKHIDDGIFDIRALVK